MANKGKIGFWLYFMVVHPTLPAVVLAFASLLLSRAPTDFPTAFFAWWGGIALLTAAAIFSSDKKASGILALLYAAFFWALLHFRKDVVQVFEYCHFYDAFMWAFKALHPR